MMNAHQPPQHCRIVQAPFPQGVGVTNQILSVVVAKNESVEWVWTHLSGGASFVSGYRIVRSESTFSP